MKFSRTTLFTATLAASYSQLGMALEEESISGITVEKYHISEAIQNIPKPLTPEGVPAHLQYIVGLDQGGAVVKNDGIPVADPEYAVSLSSGTFDGREQKLNRCYGDGWTFYDNKSKSIEVRPDEKKRSFSATGENFLSNISGSDSHCTLTFGWNKDFSEAKIDGYWEALIGDKLAMVADNFDLVIEMQPYWRWKFNGVAMEPGLLNWIKESKFANDMDMKCCPPKDNNQQCLGENKLGVKGPCETISTACGDVSENNLEYCFMFKRRNLFPGGFVEIPGFNGYPVYPLADRYGKPTPYNKFYEDAVSARGVETIFHGIERAGNDEL